MYPNIMREISNHHWAIMPDAFKGILKGVDGELSFGDYETFHRLDETAKATTLEVLGSKVKEARYSRIRSGIGSLFIEGPIIPRADAFSDISGITNIDRLTNEFNALQANPDVKRILLAIDSPGGSVTGASEFADLISNSAKPVDALNLGRMASLGYWIGSAADKVYSVDTGLTGALGTILTMPDPSNKTVIISEQTPNKGMDVRTKKGKADAQRIVNDLADIFLSSVAKNRGVKTKIVNAQFGKGSVFVGKDAFVRGMIDGVMNLREYMDSVQAVNKSDNSLRASLDLRTHEVTPKNKNTEQRKVKNMNSLQEVFAEFPALHAEFDAAKKDSFTSGVKSGEEKEQNRTKKLVPVLKSESYNNKAVKALVINVMEGKSDISALESAITVLDSLTAKEDVETASAETENTGETQAQVVESSVSEKGDIDSETEYQANLSILKGAV